MRNFDNNDGDDNGDRCHDDLMECLLRIYCAWPLELSALAQKSTAHENNISITKLYPSASLRNHSLHSL